jgi:hypothetical protein
LSNETKWKQGTKIEEFWAQFPPDTQARILDFDVDTRNGALFRSLPGLGECEIWLDACSEGEDRGGYVIWVECYDQLDEEGTPIQLEQVSEEEQTPLMFAGRSGVLETLAGD